MVSIQWEDIRNYIGKCCLLGKYNFLQSRQLSLFFVFHLLLKCEHMFTSLFPGGGLVLPFCGELSGNDSQG